MEAEVRGKIPFTFFFHWAAVVFLGFFGTCLNFPFPPQSRRLTPFSRERNPLSLSHCTIFRQEAKDRGYKLLSGGGASVGKQGFGVAACC